MSIITLDNVSWAYSRAQEWALKNISLTVEEGEFIALLGENGAGKTSICRLLNGLIPHSLPGKLLGTAMVDGIITASASVAQLAHKVGTVFEDPRTQLFTARADDEVAFALENTLLPPDETRERVAWALDAVGLSAYADRAPATLSGGQQQRLAIAAALAMAEKILVLDEPTSQLDPDGAREVLSLIRGLRDRKQLTVVMATNSAGEAAAFADRIVVLKEGSVSHDNNLATELYGKRRASHEGAEGANTLIQIDHLYYQYDSGNMILNDVNLAIADNDFFVIKGRNGCGKTTLLKNISGLLRPLRGGILLRGRDTALMSVAEIAGEIGLVMQDPDRQLFTSTVYDEVAFALKVKKRGAKRRGEIRDKVEEALSLVDLLDKRDDFPLALSRADRVKTVFAAILAMGPRIIMLDEPFAGQDSRGCRLIMDILAGLHQKGYTILVVTHNVGVVAEYAQRVVEMENGVI